MQKKIKKHLWYYILLAGILFLGLVLIFIASPNLKLQMAILLATVMVYVFWGALHHLLDHQLTARIMVEYVLIGVLGLAILFFIMMGGII